MIPDDHEVVNNLDASYNRSLSVFVSAAKRVFYEFQYRLVGDCPTFDCPLFRMEELSPGLVRLFFPSFVPASQSIGRTCWCWTRVLNECSFRATRVSLESGKCNLFESTSRKGTL
jgi:hypothetical protein